ncbi:hypothetical protein MRX96_021535 [Rhipicephalus microplus]
MALNAATDQQYHLLDQDGTADDQMDQLQGDHDTKAALAIQEECAGTDSAEPPPQSSRRGSQRQRRGSRMHPTGIITSVRRPVVAPSAQRTPMDWAATNPANTAALSADDFPNLVDFSDKTNAA